MNIFNRINNAIDDLVTRIVLPDIQMPDIEQKIAEGKQQLDELVTKHAATIRTPYHRHVEEMQEALRKLKKSKAELEEERRRTWTI